MAKKQKESYSPVCNFKDIGDTEGRDFPGGPVVKDLLANAGGIGSIPGHETKIPRAAEQLSPFTTSTEAHVL